jgi:hypothetical protein
VVSTAGMGVSVGKGVVGPTSGVVSGGVTGPWRPCCPVWAGMGIGTGIGTGMMQPARIRPDTSSADRRTAVLAVRFLGPPGFPDRGSAPDLK